MDEAGKDIGSQEHVNFRQPIIVNIETEAPSGRSEIIKLSERTVGQPIPLIMEKEIDPPSHNKHDFISISPYWYQLEDGGYEIRDGVKNPEADSIPDAGNLDRVTSNIYIMSLATEASSSPEDKQRFTRYALDNLRTWFVDADTRMNPDLNYAQVKQGGETGSFWGIIEGVRLVKVTEAVAKLEASGAISDADREVVDKTREWFRKYLQWLLADEKAIGKPDAGNDRERGGERGMDNNHGTFYDVQVACIADFVGDGEQAKATLESTRHRIDQQIEVSGQMPAETRRKNEGSKKDLDVSLDYELFNLQGLVQLAMLGEKYGVDLWGHQSPGRGGIRKAFEYFAAKLRNIEGNPFKFDRKGAMYVAFRAAAQEYGIDEYWNLPTKIYHDPLAEEVTSKLFQKPNQN